MHGLLKTTSRWTDTCSLAGRGSDREQLRASDAGDLNSPHPDLSCTEKPWNSGTHPRLTPFQRPQGREGLFLPLRFSPGAGATDRLERLRTNTKLLNSTAAESPANASLGH